MSANDNTPARFKAATGGKSQLLISQGYDHNWILNQQTRRDHRARRPEPGRPRLATRAAAAR